MDDDPLRPAIEAAFKSEVTQKELTPATVVTDYVVIAVARGWDNEGQGVDQVMIWPSDSPGYTILGLIENARIRMHADTLAGYTGDDD